MHAELRDVRVLCWDVQVDAAHAGCVNDNAAC